MLLIIIAPGGALARLLLSLTVCLAVLVAQAPAVQAAGWTLKPGLKNPDNPFPWQVPSIPTAP
jgi:hypothetical protein